MKINRLALERSISVEVTCHKHAKLQMGFVPIHTLYKQTLHLELALATAEPSFLADIQFE